MRIKHPLLADGMADPQDGSTEDLARERLRMNDGADVGHGEKICNGVFASFNINFDLREAGYAGERLAIARIFVLSRGHETPPGQRGNGRFRYLIHIVGWLVSIIFAAQLHSLLRGLAERHPSAATLAKDALIRNFILLRLATKSFGRDLPQFLLTVHGGSMRRASPRVRGW